MKSKLEINNNKYGMRKLMIQLVHYLLKFLISYYLFWVVEAAGFGAGSDDANGVFSCQPCQGFSN